MKPQREEKDWMNSKVFLGGTCNGSDWRDQLTPLLTISYFNPILPSWNEEAFRRELIERETCDYCLYVITPEMDGVYSVAEVIDDSNKRPSKTVFCVLSEHGSNRFSDAQRKSLEKVGEMVRKNGCRVCQSLEEVAEYLNTHSRSLG
jgi:hypothetical protein